MSTNVPPRGLSFLQPAGWAPAKGYANGIVAEGRCIFVAGQIGWTGQAQFESDDFVAQVVHLAMAV